MLSDGHVFIHCPQARQSALSFNVAGFRRLGQLLASRRSLTADYLAGRKSVAGDTTPRSVTASRSETPYSLCKHLASR